MHSVLKPLQFCRTSFNSIVASAIQQKHLSDDQPLAMFFNLSQFNQRCNELRQSFRNAGCDNIKHTFALKALPIPKIINHAKSLGFGAECASMGEIHVALHSGMNPKDIVYDSPCKTIKELKYAIKKNIHFNMDNFQEVERVKTIINGLSSIPNDLCIGIRVNPAVGSGSIAATSTATADSKFGVNIDEYYNQLCKYYIKFPWLNSIHCHIGSQAMSIDQTVKGIKKMVELVETINEKRRNLSLMGNINNSNNNNNNSINIYDNYDNDGIVDYDDIDISDGLYIRTIDIGGGLAINYNNDKIKPTFYDFVKQLKNKVPVLFNQPNKYQLITEFGRSLVQKSGFIVSKVEYIKQNGKKNIAIIHAGAQMLVRTAYQPDIWKHRLSVYKPNEKCGHVQDLQDDIDEKSEEDLDLVQYDIAGPLCFSGDYVARDVWLPRLSCGDYIIIHDCGGYCYSMFSRYNSRYAPPIYGYTNPDGNNNNNKNNSKNKNSGSHSDSDNISIHLLKKGETHEDIVEFWS